jgi:hypothetical protein
MTRTRIVTRSSQGTASPGQAGAVPGIDATGTPVASRTPPAVGVPAAGDAAGQPGLSPAQSRPVTLRHAQAGPGGLSAAAAAALARALDPMGAAIPGTGLPARGDLPLGVGAGSGAVPAAVPGASQVATDAAGSKPMTSWQRLIANGKPEWWGRRRQSQPASLARGLTASQIDDRRLVAAVANGRRSVRGGLAAAGARAYVVLALRAGIPATSFVSTVVEQARASAWSGEGCYDAATRWCRSILKIPGVTAAQCVRVMAERMGKRAARPTAKAA